MFIFYSSPEVRKRRRDFLDVLVGATGRDLTPQELDKCKDFLAEVQAKMGKELRLAFDHTQIKDTAWYPMGFAKEALTVAALRDKALAVLDGKANIGIEIK